MLNVIIPVYNSQETLPDALASLVAQTQKRFWVTIVADGDGVDYDPLITRYKSLGLHITFIKLQNNVGPGLARQAALDADINGMFDYVSFLDSDDMFYPRAVEVLYHNAKKNLADLVFTDFVVEREHKDPIFLKSNEMPCQWLHGKAYRTQYLRDIGLKFPMLSSDEDSYFNLVAHNSTKKKFYVGEQTYLWRDNKNSITRSEEDGEFFKKDFKNYVWSQKHGLMDIVKATGELNSKLCAMTLNHIYHTVMRARHFKLDYESVENDLWELWEIPEIVKTADDIDFWTTLEDKVKACNMVGEDFYFFKMRFIDWFNQVIRRLE